MSITISTYTTFDELRGLLGKFADCAAFVVPTAHDSEWLLGLLGGDEALFSNFRAHSWSDLYRAFADKNANCTRLRQIDPPDHRLILRHITDQFKENNPEITKKLPGLARASFVDLLSDTLHELLSEEILPENIENLDNLNDSSKILTPLYQSYINYLERERLMDSTQVATKTREIITEGVFDSLVFVGFLSFTHGQKKLIEALSQFVKISIFKPESYVKGLHDASSQFVNHRRGHTSENEGGRYFLLDSADTLFEPAIVARELALWSCGEGVFAQHEFPGWGGIGLLVPRANAPELETALSRYRVPSSSFTARRVSDTPLGYLPKRIYSAYLGGWQEEETRLLLAHPCLGDEVAMSKFCKAIERGGTPIMLLEALHNFVSAKGLFRDAIEKILGSDESGAFDSSLREVSSAISELERKLIFMKELQPKIGPAGEMKFAGVAAIEYLQNWAREAQTATQPPIENSVSVFDSLPTLANFDVFLIMGVSARTFPGNLISSPLLDEEGKNKLNEFLQNDSMSHLPTIHEQRIQKDALLKRLLYAGNNFTIISRPLNDEKGRPLSPSPSLAPIIISEKWSQIGCAKGTNLIPNDEPYFSEIEILGSEKNIFRAVPIAKNAQLSEVSISKIDELVECPFLYWAKQIKKIREPARGIYDAALAGSLAHAIWETAWKIKRETGENLQKIVEEILTSPSHSDIYPALFTDKRLARRKELLRAQMIESAILQDEIEKKLCSQKTGIEIEKKVSLKRDGVLFKGRCDRVDLFGSDCVVIDYKGGKSEQKFQLGVYAAALTEEGFAVRGAGHIILRGNEVLGTFDPPLNLIYVGRNTRTRVETLISETETALAQAAATVKNGEYKPNYDSKFCRRCAFVPLCRRAEMRGEATSEEESVLES